MVGRNDRIQSVVATEHLDHDQDVVVLRLQCRYEFHGRERAQRNSAKDLCTDGRSGRCLDKVATFHHCHRGY